MSECLWLLLAFVASLLGMAWLALAMDEHWQQARGPGLPGAATQRLLRFVAGMALAVSLWACFLADHPSMAPLVWIMSLAVAALLVALLLAWCPRVLAALWP